MAVKNKFNARKVLYKDMLFDSTKECNRYKHYETLQKAFGNDRVAKLERQVRYDFKIGTKLIFFYLLDLRITFTDGTVKHEDVKGYKKGPSYQLFKVKKKIIEATYSITIDEV